MNETRGMTQQKFSKIVTTMIFLFSVVMGGSRCHSSSSMAFAFQLQTIHSAVVPRGKPCSTPYRYLSLRQNLALDATRAPSTTSSSSRNDGRKRFSNKLNTGKSDSSSSSSSSPPLYIQEGVFAVNKPLGWSSQQVVGKIRSLLEKDAKARGVPDPRKKRRKPWVKIGHGGTLDPLATGVLVVGVGKGTKVLQDYLKGSKGYKAGIELGFQTTTLDLDPNGEVVATKPYGHVTKEAVEDVLVNFRGTIPQIPPIFSALKKDGKKLYELGRKGQTEEDIEIEPRQVQIHRLDLLWDYDDGIINKNKEDDDDDDDDQPPASPPRRFGIDVECGGGTYIRSLVRDIGLSLDTVATMTSLERTKQGAFLPEHCLQEEEWTPENVWKAISAGKAILAEFNKEEE